VSEGHSKFSASAAERWLTCPGSMVLSQGKPDSPSYYASEGTAAHRLLDGAISNGVEPREMLGTVWQIDGHDITVTQEMVDAVEVALATVREMTVNADILVGESRVNYAHWLNVPTESAWGTSDVIAVIGTELLVYDYKHGMGVEVDAERNSQLLLYAGGALLEYQDLADIRTVRMVIHQPRIKSAPSEWCIAVEELTAWLTGRARSGACSVINAENHDRDALPVAWNDTYLNPTEKACRWCKAKATCPALRDEVVGRVFEALPASPDEFVSMSDSDPDAILDTRKDDPAWLAACLSKVDLIEDWCKAVRAEVERRLLAGDTVPGYKLVAGKRGARAWTDEAEAEKLLKTMRLKSDVMYDFTVKSPTQIAKLGPALDSEGKPKPPKPGEPMPIIGPRQWPKVAALIKQPPGKPHVAPLSDKRPALEIRPVADDFEAASAAESDLV